MAPIMRILDKNTDFYDFYAGIYRDDSLVFDRTDSFVLTHEEMKKHVDIEFGYHMDRNSKRCTFILMQICNTFWLFCVSITKTDNNCHVKDYTIEEVTHWENYGIDRVLIRMEFIHFGWPISRKTRDEIMADADTLKQLVDIKDYKSYLDVCNHVFYRGNERVEKHIPLLKASGIAPLVDPLEVYLAFEKFFALEKTSTERTQSVGLTNNEKITNHGFDLKNSFRGKNTT